MKTQKLGQFGLAFCLVLSLLASLIAAGAFCTHHLEDKMDSLSCHEHSAKESQLEIRRDSNPPPVIQKAVAETECFCIQSAPNVSAKSESVKFEKQLATISSVKQIETGAASRKLRLKS